MAPAESTASWSQRSRTMVRREVNKAVPTWAVQAYLAASAFSVKNVTMRRLESRACKQVRVMTFVQRHSCQRMVFGATEPEQCAGCARGNASRDVLRARAGTSRSSSAPLLTLLHALCLTVRTGCGNNCVTASLGRSW